MSCVFYHGGSAIITPTNFRHASRKYHMHMCTRGYWYSALRSRGPQNYACPPRNETVAKSFSRDLYIDGNKRRPPGSRRAIERVDYQKSRTIDRMVIVMTEGHRGSGAKRRGRAERGRNWRLCWKTHHPSFRDICIYRGDFVYAMFRAIGRVWVENSSYVRFGTRSNRFHEDSAITIYANLTVPSFFRPGGWWVRTEQFVGFASLHIGKYISRRPAKISYRLNDPIRELKLEPSFNYMTNFYFVIAK